MQEKAEGPRCERERFERLARGDLSALAETYDAHAQRLFGHALWMTRNRQDAEDTVHNVFAKLAAMCSRLRGIRHPAAYLFQMTHRESVDVLRRRATRAEDPIDSVVFMPDSSDSEAMAETAELERQVTRLDAPQREVLFLHLLEGLTFREIGRIMDTSTFTAASRYRIAIRRLREAVGIG